MKKYGRLFRVGILSFLMGCFAGQTNTSPTVVSVPYDAARYKLIEEHKKKTVALVVKNKDGDNFAYCTGVWIKKGMILTANHCIEDEGMIIHYSTESDYQSQISRMAIVVAVDKKNDLALLFVDPSNEPEHLIAELPQEDNYSLGEDIDIIGHTVGYTWSYSRGHISAMRVGIMGPHGVEVEKVAQVSAPVWMGNSGGGAFDGNGKLVGICSWISRRGPFLSFFVHHEVIEKFISDKELPLK